jgi:hypothetical protein
MQVQRLYFLHLADWYGKNIFNGRLAIKSLTFDKAFNKYGNYLLSAFWCSTIGHEGLNFSVRYETLPKNYYSYFTIKVLFERKHVLI